MHLHVVNHALPKVCHRKLLLVMEFAARTQFILAQIELPGEEDMQMDRG
jgi:hypothetical protein